MPKRNLLEQCKNVQFSPKNHRYMEWTEGRGDNGKDCILTERINLNKYRYRDRTTRVWLRPCILQLGKYTSETEFSFLFGTFTVHFRE